MKKICLLFFIFVPVIFSQQAIDKMLYLTSNKVGISAAYQNLKIGDEKLSQIAFPVNLLIPLSNNFTVNIFNGSALSKYQNTELNGLGETRLGIRYIFPGEKLMIRGLFGLPTGKTKLDNDQFFISQLLSLNPFDYPVSYYGQGLNSNISLIYALPISRNLVIGAGAAYNYRGTYYPRNTVSGGKFDPGDEIVADAGMDLKLSEMVKVNLDLVYTIFMKDKLDDVEIFKLGDKISVYFGLNAKFLGTGHNIFIITRIKSNNRSYSESSEEDLKTGSQIDLNYDANIPLSSLLSLLLKADGRFYKDSEQIVGGELLYTGQASLVGAGGGLSFLANDFIRFELYAEYKSGKIKLPKSTGEKNISGTVFGLNSIFKF